MLLTNVSIHYHLGGGEDDDGEPDKMAIAFQRISRFKAWIKGGIVGFFRGIRNGVIRLIRRGDSRSGTEVPLEVIDNCDLVRQNKSYL